MAARKKTATKKQAGKGKTPQKKGNGASPKPASSAPQRRRSPEEALADSSDILDNGTRRDIAGVCFIVLAVVLMLFVCLPQDNAFISGYASTALRLVLGVGCYILPLILLAIGISYLRDTNKQHFSARVTIGLSIIFVALLGFIALFAPIENIGVENPSLLFYETALVNYGGYIGSGIAWAGIVLLGRVISGVVLVGLMVIGLIVIGFSISKSLAAARLRKQAAEPLSPQRSRSASTGFARVRMADEQHRSPEEIYAQMQGVEAEPYFDPNQTAVFGQQMQLPVEEIEPMTRRLPEIPDADGATRRLVPIEHAEEFDYEGYSEGGQFEDGEYEGSYGGSFGDFEEEGYEDYPYDQEDEHSSESYEEEPLKEPDLVFSEEDFVVGGEQSLELMGEDSALVIPKITKSAIDAASGNASKPVPASKNGKRTGSISGDSRNAGDGSKFKLPSMKLLKKSPSRKRKSSEDLSGTADKLQETLANFGIYAEVVDWIAGPTVTLFEVNLPAGVRVSRVTALNDDIALALASPGIRIFAPIPGTNYVGIEVPNSKRESVLLSDVLEKAPDGPLQFAIGKDVEGHAIVSNLAEMPHLLIGGTTGSGKSVSINAMIMSMLMRATPDEVRLILIDPKTVEFTLYNDIPHLYVPVVTDPKDASSALAWGVAEMERRLKIFSKYGARNLSQYNSKAKKFNSGIESNTVEAEGSEEPAETMEVMPYIVIVIDELADLMMNVGKDVEISISRIAQKARAAGIHLVLATQRPSTNVVTGLIKANITNRIAFNVASSIDSRVILDTTGAENLIGHGDLLLNKPELAKPQRIQGCYVSEDEIESVVEFIKGQGSPEYHTEILNTNTYTIGDTDPAGGSSSSYDPLVWEAAEIVVGSSMGSTSNLQRRLKVGYARAGRIMDQLEEIGIVGPANGSRPRDVLVDEMELETIKAFEEADE